MRYSVIVEITHKQIVGWDKNLTKKNEQTNEIVTKAAEFKLSLQQCKRRTMRARSIRSCQENEAEQMEEEPLT
jgi:hypothetical protein